MAVSHQVVQPKLLPFTDFGSITPETKISDLNLSWKERDLPQGMRTKHVHRLHPYLGKFVPQLVEIFLRKYQPRFVVDPFCGSGTTLVEALSLGIDGFGADISEFNCLLSNVKIAAYYLPVLKSEINDIFKRSTQEINEDHEPELNDILASRGGDVSERVAVCDVFIEDFRTGLLCLEIKEPTPNLDTASGAKRNMLYFQAIMHRQGQTDAQAYLGFYYNPWITRQAYQHWTTRQIMDIDQEVLMGAELWD